MLDNSLRRTAWTVLALTAVAASTQAQQTVNLPARDVSLQDRPTPVFTVGVEEGRDWEMFADVRAVAFDATDNLYVLDGQNHRVIVFDARGRYLRHFGKRGGGPGEFQAPLNLVVGSDGNLVISDLANRAFVIYKPTGEYVRNIPFSEELGMPIGDLYSDGRGGVISRAMPRPPMRMEPGAGTRDVDNVSTIFRQPLQERATIATLYRITMPPPQVQESSGGDQRRIAMVRMDPVFGPTPLFAALPNSGLAVQHDSEYAVKVLDANGRVVRTLARAYAARKVTKKDQDAWRERRRSGEGAGTTVSVTMGPSGSSTSVRSPGAARGRGGNDPVLLNLDNVPFAESMSIVTDLTADPDGRLWIQRRKDDGSNAGPIDIVTAEGRYIGTLPAQALPNAISASGLAAYVVRDDLDVQRVTVRRLPQSWR